MCQIFAQISTSVVFGPPYLELGRFTGKQKQTCQGLMICLPPHQNWVRQVPPTPRTVGARGIPKGKSGKFLIYHPFQRPRPSTARPMLYHLLGLQLLQKGYRAISPNSPLTVHRGSPKRSKVEISYISSIPAAHVEYTATNVIPPIAAVADVKRLPCHIPQFAPDISQGQKLAAPTRVNLEFGTPSYLGNYYRQQAEILHTFTQCQVHFCNMKIFPLGVWGHSAPRVNFGPPSYLGNYQTQRVEIFHTSRQGKVHFLEMKIFPLGGISGVQRPLL